MRNMRLSTPLTLLALLPVSASFAPASHSPKTRGHERYRFNGGFAMRQTSPSSSSTERDVSMNSLFDRGVVAPKLSFRPPLAEERGKGGVDVKESVAALEVMARIPRSLILATCDSSPRAIAASAEATTFSWAANLCASALVALFPEAGDDDKLDEDVTAKQTWIGGWKEGGWATDGADLGPPDVDWGSKHCTGSLLATGSDNDKNVFAKFRFPCHPAVHRAGLGLALLSGADDQDSLDALLLRGRAFRGMRDALLPLVLTPTERKGSLRQRRAWDVADVLSRVLSRATTLQLVDDENTPVSAVVPIHERLAHCDARGENSKLVVMDDEVLLVATRDISVGEAVTRDYATAPSLDGDSSEGALRLLLQFGLPPNAW